MIIGLSPVPLVEEGRPLPWCYNELETVYCYQGEHYQFDYLSRPIKVSLGSMERPYIIPIDEL